MWLQTQTLAGSIAKMKNFRRDISGEKYPSPLLPPTTQDTEGKETLQKGERWDG